MKKKLILLSAIAIADVFDKWACKTHFTALQSLVEHFPLVILGVLLC